MSVSGRFDRRLGIVAALVIGGAALAWQLVPESVGPLEPVVSVGAEAPALTDDRSAAGSTAADSPFDVVAGQATDTRSPSGDAAVIEPSSERAGERDLQAKAVPGAAGPPDIDLEIDSIGRDAWTNEGFAAMAARLRSDPAAMTLLIEAFRAETDPDRLERLAALLGEVGHPDLAELGSQMIASGDPASRSAGLALLQRIQADDAQAHDALVGLLATETDPEVLASVLSAVSAPGDASVERSGAVVAQLIPLIAHPSAAVRRNGVTVLSRWADDASVAPVLRQALNDADAGVRDSAVYAFANQSRLDPAARQDLFSVLEDTQEKRSTRSGAALALSGADLDDQQAQRLEAAKRQLASQL